VLFDRLLQEALSGSYIAPFTQEEINSLPFFVYTPIPIDPFAFELDIRYINAPGGTHRLCITTPSLLEFRDLVDCSVSFSTNYNLLHFLGALQRALFPIAAKSICTKTYGTLH
jgi:hypothetical protein